VAVDARTQEGTLSRDLERQRLLHRERRIEAVLRVLEGGRLGDRRGAAPRPQLQLAIRDFRRSLREVRERLGALTGPGER
jgi:hypothetical protein